ncbi:MAG TPA: TolC family protein [Bacteroidia bacterium]|nr:TolC family protein [Bacteroidia bacterium]
MIRIKTSLSVLLLLITMQLFAQKSDSIFHLSLQQSIDYALANQPNVRNAKYEEGKADAKVKEVLGIGLPQITGSINLLDYLQIPTTLIPAQFFGGPAGTFEPLKFGTQYSLTGEIDGSQIIFDGTYIVGLRASKIYKTLSVQDLTLANIQAVAAVKKAYYSVLVNNWKLQMTIADVNRLKKLMDETQKMNEAGFTEKVDYDRIKVNYNNIKTLQATMGKVVTLSYKMLKFQMGMPLKDSITLTDSLRNIPINPELEADTSFRATNRIEYQIAQTNLFGNHELLKKDRYAYLPNLILIGSVNRVNQGETTDFFNGSQPWYPTAIVGLKMNIPIFDGLQKNYRIQQDKYSVQENELQLSTLKESISLEISNSMTNLENALADLKNQQENMQLAQSVEHDTKIKYEAGTGSNLEVVDAETSLTEAETNYYNALYNALIARVDYEQAKGTLIKK